MWPPVPPRPLYILLQQDGTEKDMFPKAQIDGSLPICVSDDEEEPVRSVVLSGKKDPKSIDGHPQDQADATPPMLIYSPKRAQDEIAADPPLLGPRMWDVYPDRCRNCSRPETN